MALAMELQRLLAQPLSPPEGGPQSCGPVGVALGRSPNRSCLSLAPPRRRRGRTALALGCGSPKAPRIPGPAAAGGGARWGERGELNPRPREPQSGDGLPASGQQNAQTKPEQLAVEIQVQWLREGQEILLPTVEALRALLLAQEPLATLLRRGAVRIKGVARG